MDKASSALRRSSVKLRSSLGGPTGHGDLQLVINQLRDTKSCHKALAKSESAAWQDIANWGTKEENRAVQDVLVQAGELAKAWSEVQSEMTDGLRDFRNQFERILEGERGVDNARAALEVADAKEMKLHKEFKKSNRKLTPDEIEEWEGKLRSAKKERELAQIEVLDRVKEHETVKMMRVKEAMKKISLAYLSMSSKCEVVFEANKHLAEQIPDIQEGRELADMRYDGDPRTIQIVAKTKEKLRQDNKRKTHSIEERGEELPPPYTCSESSSFQDLSLNALHISNSDSINFHNSSVESHFNSSYNNQTNNSPGFHSSQNSSYNNGSNVQYPNLESMARNQH